MIASGKRRSREAREVEANLAAQALPVNRLINGLFRGDRLCLDS